MRIEAFLLALARIAQRVGHDPALPGAAIAVLAFGHIVAGRMQMAVDPEVGIGQQVIEHIAKAGGARGQSIARIGAAQAGRKVGDDDGLAIKGLGQCGAQPFLAAQRFVAHLGGQEGLAVALHLGLGQVKVRGLESLLALLHQRAQLGHAVVQRNSVVVGPQRGADKAHAVDDQGVAVEHGDAQLFAAGAQAQPGGIEILVVELMVAGHQDHRLGPMAAGLLRAELGEAKIGIAQHRAILVGANVAGQHQQLGAGRRLGTEMGVGLQMQVGQNLQVHGRQAYHGLWRLAAPLHR